MVVEVTSAQTHTYINMEDAKKYTVTHHVATGKFTYFEFQVEADLKTVISQANWLREQFINVEK